MKNFSEKKIDIKKTKLKAAEIRKAVLKMISGSNSSHIGSCFSIIDILAVLYSDILNVSDPKDENRDIFVLSKGHAAAALYATLAYHNFFPIEELDTFGKNGTKLAGHPIISCVPGVEASTGSLGHGLSITAGFALGNKNTDRRFFCLLGDGECNEGSVWEAALFCSQFKLNNLTAIIDKNGLQGLGKTKEILNFDLAAVWRGFGWNVIEVEGHDHKAIFDVLNRAPENDRPTVIVANTIKGKGVSWMENNNDWHYKSPKQDQLSDAEDQICRI